MTNWPNGCMAVLFLTIVPVLMVPSVFCISPTGDQLSVFSGVTDAHQLVLTLNQGFQVSYSFNLKERF